MSADGNWCLIESDPGVFTELMRGFGVHGLECEELYDLKNHENVSDALGLIFLFKWEGTSEKALKIASEEEQRSIFFAKQVITNACATQAIINLLMNVEKPSIDIGSTLKEFRGFVDQFDSTMKGTALSNAEKIRSVHNSFTSYHGFEVDDPKRKTPEDVYHFVSYVPINGVLYELDGLKQGPIDHGKIPDRKPWIDHAIPIIQERMDRCVDGNFNLMAVVPDRLSLYSDQLTRVRAASETPAPELIAELERNIESEKKKNVSYREENIRRRHNYLPLIIELLKVLGEQGRLVDLVQKAKEESQAKASKSGSVKT